MNIRLISSSVEFKKLCDKCEATGNVTFLTKKTTQKTTPYSTQNRKGTNERNEKQ